jgi:hypothetical protein
MEQSFVCRYHVTVSLVGERHRSADGTPFRWTGLFGIDCRIISTSVRLQKSPFPICAIGNGKLGTMCVAIQSRYERGFLRLSILLKLDHQLKQRGWGQREDIRNRSVVA